MPVTARRSRAFYDKFGDEVTNELVNWFNQVDLTYRTELRDLNELNYARFEAKLEQRMAELAAELRAELGELRHCMEAGFARFDAKLESLEHRMLGRLASQRASLLKWMFAFWVAQAAMTAGLAVAISR